MFGLLRKRRATEEKIFNLIAGLEKEITELRYDIYNFTDTFKGEQFITRVVERINNLQIKKPE